MAGERDMNKRIASEFMCRPYHQISAGDKIVVYNQIRHTLDIIKHVKRFPCDAQYVGSLFLDLLKCLRCSFNRLIDDDRLYLRIIHYV